VQGDRGLVTRGLKGLLENREEVITHNVCSCLIYLTKFQFLGVFEVTQNVEKGKINSKRCVGRF
jgi:hypothetical protein